MKNKIILGVVGVFVLIMIIAGVSNRNKSDSTTVSDDDVITTDEEPTVVVAAPTEDYSDSTESTTPKYDAQLGLEAERNNDGRVDIPDPEPETETETEEVQTDPTYETSVKIFDHTVVPTRNVDGSSCKAYLNSVTLESFGTYWGTDLTDKDFKGGKFYMVGVEQNPDDTVKGVDLQSTGWLINHLSNMKASDAIKFANLHVIGSMSASHVALLCSYDWYSAFGLKDTLVVFEDISNTLKTSDFKDGDIFSATVYAHNVKVMHVNGFDVVVVEYNTFK